MTVVGEAGWRDALHHRDGCARRSHSSSWSAWARRTSSPSGPEKKVRVPVKGTKRRQFILDRGRAKGVGQGDGEPGDLLGPGGAAPGPGEAGT